MCPSYQKNEGIDLSNDKMAMQRIKEAAEKAKKELSQRFYHQHQPALYHRYLRGSETLDMNLTKAKFDELTHDLVELTAEPVTKALSDAGITASELGKVLLVGGSTRIPAVQEKVKQLTRLEPSKTLNPDECVALGASVQGRQAGRRRRRRGCASAGCNSADPVHETRGGHCHSSAREKYHDSYQEEPDLLHSGG